MIARADLKTTEIHRQDAVRWEITSDPVPYTAALARMDAESSAIAEGAQELVWLLEHPPLYTSGTSAKPQDLVLPDRFPVYETGRGGQYTYHGPGQRIAYTMLNLKSRGGDVRKFVSALEEWIIQTLSACGVTGERREDRVGVWVATKTGEAKIAALGIRIRKGVTLHGISINVNPDLSHYDGIIPCGINEYGVTSLEQLGVKTTMHEVDQILREKFHAIFG